MPSLTALVTFSYIRLVLSAKAGILSMSKQNSKFSPNIGTSHSLKSDSNFLKCGIIVSSYNASLASATFA